MIRIARGVKAFIRRKRGKGKHSSAMMKLKPELPASMSIIIFARP